MKYFVWGLGLATRTLLRSGYLNKAQIAGFIDKNDSTYVYSGGIDTYTPEEAVSHITDTDYILVMATKLEVRKSIYRQAVLLGYPEARLLFIHNDVMELRLGKIHEQDDSILQELVPRIYAEQKEHIANREKGKHVTYACEADVRDKDRLVGTGKLPDDKHYVLDYERFRTFELAVSEIQRRKVRGATAELGVFRGVFSRLIHAQLPERRHYMYDSFESFRPEEIKNEIARGVNNRAFWEGFKNTSPAIALKGMISPENCVIRKGFFPESLAPEDKDERFAFVSIDVDMEESTYQGLKFFYPRMVRGGFIFMHDYNAPAIRNAVRRYEKELGDIIRGVHLSDCCGTLVIPV